MEEHGLSKTAARGRIADAYGTSLTTVRDYLNSYGTRPNFPKRSYHDRLKTPGYLEWAAMHNRWRYDPARFIASTYKSPDESLSLEDISLRLKSAYNLMPHLNTLEKLVEQGHPRTGEPILSKTNEQPPLYKLVDGLFERYKDIGDKR